MYISKIEGIGPEYADQLSQHGIRTTHALLRFAATRSGRKELAARLNLSEKIILDWVNRADLMRVNGIGKEYSDLLEAAGVDTVRELGVRRPDNLHRKVLDINAKRKLVRRVPSLTEIERWIEDAKRMLPLVTH